MTEDRKEKLLRQLQEQEERQKKLKARLKELEQREAKKRKQEEEKRWKMLGSFIDSLLISQFGQDYFRELGKEQVEEYLIQIFQTDGQHASEMAERHETDIQEAGYGQ